MTYTKNQQSQSTAFQTEPQSVPIPFGVVGLAIVPALFFAILSWIASVGVFLLFGICAWLMSTTPSARRYRAPSAFTVDPEGVLIGNKQIPRRDIHRVIVRNHVLAEDESSDVVFVSDGLMAGQAAAGMHARGKFRKKLAAISYRVDVEAGGTATTLAGGLNQTTAFAVLSDVSSILGMKGQ